VSPFGEDEVQFGSTNRKRGNLTRFALMEALAETYVRRAEMLRAVVAARQGVMPLAVVDLLEGGVGGGVGWVEG
jgi:hypothetical protein